MGFETLKAAGVLFTPGQVVEVRAIADDRIASGYFNNIEKLVYQVDTLDGLSDVQGIYVTLNEVNPALLSRRENRIKVRLSKKDATTADNAPPDYPGCQIPAPSRPKGQSRESCIPRFRPFSLHLSAGGMLFPRAELPASQISP